MPTEVCTSLFHLDQDARLPQQVRERGSSVVVALDPELESRAGLEDASPTERPEEAIKIDLRFALLIISEVLAPRDAKLVKSLPRESGELRLMVDEAVWDFHPSFMKDSRRPQFNARIESVATNGLWKGAFASSRRIVPMRGYFEWTVRGADGKKYRQPHFIHGPGELLAAAGIYTACKVGDEWEVSTAMITREARDASGELHDRMPAFLEAEVWDRWLEPTKWDEAEKADALAMLAKVSEQVASTITTYEVDRKVNNSRTVDPQDASLVERV